MMKSRSLSKLLAAMMVVALLVMALPMTILAEPPAHAKANRDRALGRDKVKVEDVEEEEPSEEEEEMSWRAEFVHARNEWAKSVVQATDEVTGKMRIPPGHANLMLKYLMSLETSDVQSGEEPVVETEAILLFSDYAEKLALLYESLKTPEEPTDEDPTIKEPIIDPLTGRLNVKAFKEWAGMLEEDDLAPETTVA